MNKNDPQFYRMSAKSDLMKVAQSAGRLTNPESYETWILFLKKALENVQKLENEKKVEFYTKQIAILIQPREKVLYDARSRLKWAEKVLDIACMI